MIAVNDRAPASTAATAASNSEVSVCRTPADHEDQARQPDARPGQGHSPASRPRSPAGRSRSCARAGPISDDDTAGTAFREDQWIRHPHDLGSRACPALRTPERASGHQPGHHATMPRPWNCHLWGWAGANCRYGWRSQRSHSLQRRPGGLIHDEVVRTEERPPKPWALRGGGLASEPL